MTGEEIAADIVNNSLYGDLYAKDEGATDAQIYRMGNLRSNSTPIVWGAFNLTKNCRETIDIQYLDKMRKVSKNSLNLAEKRNLERLLQVPRECK